MKDSIITAKTIRIVSLAPKKELPPKTNAKLAEYEQYTIYQAKHSEYLVKNILHPIWWMLRILNVLNVKRKDLTSINQEKPKDFTVLIVPKPKPVWWMLSILSVLNVKRNNLFSIIQEKPRDFTVVIVPKPKPVW
jgi:hypothetical protein